MYVPPQFAEPSTQELHRFIETHGLGMLVTKSASAGFEAEHLPFLIDAAGGEAGVLLAHVARANPVWQRAIDGDEVFVVFRGAEGYISPNWYPGKLETHRRVPTWNYEVVHAHGTIRVRDEERFTRGVVAKLTRHFEAAQATPWKMGDAPADFIDEQLKHIVGIEVVLTRLEGKRKLNQHHAEQDRAGAIEGLKNQSNSALAGAMRCAKPYTP